VADLFDDLEAEQDRLEVVLGSLDEAAWKTESAARGWSVSDVVLHLAQTEEGVVLSATGSASKLPAGDEARTVEEAVDALVRAERDEPQVVFERWKRARRAAVMSLRDADPGLPLRWAAAPLKPKALATTRLAEHWAHGLDITEPLGIPFADTGRLRHVAWLAHRSLPYAFSLAGEEPCDVYCELEGPLGEEWNYGPPDAESQIRGRAGAFCRVGARRLAPETSGLAVEGPNGEKALSLLRNYAR
jgi:uncharacterized protein (TIGR03084 family)